MEDLEAKVQNSENKTPNSKFAGKETRNSLTMVAHFVVVLFTGYMLYIAQPGSSLFSWHPTLMTLAFVFCMLEGIIFFSSQSSLFPKLERATKVRLHWIFLLCAAACSVLGLMAIYSNKENGGKPHFTTWHGKIGLAAVIYTCSQCCAGPLLLYPNFLLPKSIKLYQAKAYHATSGLVLFSLVCLSLFLGMWSKWFTSQVTGTSWYACLACPMIMALVVMQQISGHYLPKQQFPGLGGVEQKKKEKGKKSGRR